ncbi:MAG: N-acetylmuramoyl-L-alanine amidase [Clostridia bacterium]|nr:N-acetylmuramoyl-L-alanine amidase [Clostridia bacterium]
MTDIKHKIYVSPANHYKPYAIDGYTEKEQMDKLAPLLVKELEKYKGVEVFLTDIYNPDRSYTGRPEAARNLGCDIYVALHSNAGGGKGACLFYHPDYPLSRLMALAVVGALNDICPIKSNRAVQPAIYPWSRGQWNFGELRLPASYGMAPILIEHEFHDTKEGAAWLISSLPEIAKADADAIALVLGLEKKKVKGDANGDGTVNSLDAAAILRYDAGISNLTEEQKTIADINGDGTVNSLDAAEILKQDSK